MCAIKRLFAIIRIRIGGMRRFVLSEIGTKYVKSHDLMQLCVRFQQNHSGHHWNKMKDFSLSCDKEKS